MVVIPPRPLTVAGEADVAASILEIRVQISIGHSRITRTPQRIIFADPIATSHHQ
jgi:hypothetical protein